MSVSAPAQPAQEFGLVPASFTLTRSGPTSADVAVDYTTSGSAAAGSDYTALSGRVIIPPGASSAVVSVTPLADTLAEGDETATLALATDTLGNFTSGVPASGNLTINDVPTDAWRFSFFNNAELANPAISGNTADPDNDGISNLVERLLSLHPRQVSARDRLPVAALLSGRLRVSYRRGKGLSDLLNVVEVTSALDQATSWSSVPADVQLVPPIIDHGDGTETLTFEDQNVPGLPRRFMRLRTAPLSGP